MREIVVDNFAGGGGSRQATQSPREAEGGIAVAKIIPRLANVFARMGARFPFVLESRKYGIIGNAYTTDGDFYEWFRQWWNDHDELVYMRDWRCWETEPTEAERQATPWE